MNTALHTTMLGLAKQAATYIDSLNGTSESFIIEGDTLSAEIEYKAQTGSDAGDYWTAPSWWVTWETVKVIAVFDEDGKEDTEAAKWLANMLN